MMRMFYYFLVGVCGHKLVETALFPLVALVLDDARTEEAGLRREIALEDGSKLW